jgi:hypothetical protein
MFENIYLYICKYIIYSTFIMFFGIIFTKNVTAQPDIALIHLYKAIPDSIPNLQNGLAKTPPMGWNSWNHFRCYGINEQVIKETADAMVENGMKDAGYKYVIIDDCWQAFSRDANGDLQANPKRFPSGIKALADYVHQLGLKLGIYAAPGSETCAMHYDSYPAKGIGSYGHVKQDAKQFAKWGIDYLKYDWCRANITDELKPTPAFKRMRNALEATGRPILYSIHPPPENKRLDWSTIANMWRTTGDIRDNWNRMISIVDQQVRLSKYADPDHWNDPDMLEVGNGGMTTTEYQAHFSLWAMLAAPLIAGNDLRHMSTATKHILKNKAAIAVDQDPKGVEGHKVADHGNREVWVKPLSDGSEAVLLLNRGPKQTFMTATAEQVGLPKANYYKETNLWTHKIKRTDDLIRGFVPSHGVLMFRVWPESK